MTRILVVEDEPSLATGLKEDLSIEGYEVDVAGDGQTALARASAERFDLIVLDVMLPKRDGLEVCRQLRRQGSAVPVLMLTARAQESDKVLGLEIGADDYVTKPFSGRELRARIKALLRRSHYGTLPEVARFGEVEVDFARCELRRAGAVVEVTPVEIKMLAAFVRQPGRTLTRDRILGEVWGDTSVTDRVVDAHIVNLRRKIEPVATEPRYIVSVRGIGYRFDPE